MGAAEEESALARLNALRHLSPREAAKAWGVPKSSITAAAARIRKEWEGDLGRVADGWTRCAAPVRSQWGLPCQVSAEPGGTLCAYHVKAVETPAPEVLDSALVALRAEADWDELSRRIGRLTKTNFRSEQARLRKALEARAPLDGTDYRLASFLLPSPDPATQGRRALGLPGPNDGIGDVARLQGLALLLAAVDLQTFGAAAPPAAQERDPQPPKLLYSVQEAARRLNVGVAWLRQESAVGNVPHREVGGRRMFSEADLLAIVEATYRPSRKHTPPSVPAALRDLKPMPRRRRAT